MSVLISVLQVVYHASNSTISVMISCTSRVRPESWTGEQFTTRTTYHVPIGRTVERFPCRPLVRLDRTVLAFGMSDDCPQFFPEAPKRHLVMTRFVWLDDGRGLLISERIRPGIRSDASAASRSFGVAARKTSCLLKGSSERLHRQGFGMLSQNSKLGSSRLGESIGESKTTDEIPAEPIEHGRSRLSVPELPDMSRWRLAGWSSRSCH